MDKYYFLPVEVEKYRSKLIRFFAKNGIKIDLTIRRISNDQNNMRFKIKLGKTTTIPAIKKFLREAQLYLKVDRLELNETVPSALYFEISVNAMSHVDLIKGLNDLIHRKALEGKTLAHYIGNDMSGNPVIGDFAEEVHVLSTGTTNSGKSCSATSMILSLACFYSPKKVNLILCDKAAGLNKFSDLPHCACKTVRTDEDFEAVMYMVFDEMERRSQLEGTEEFRKMSHIIIMIDEFPSFLSQDKKVQR